MNDLRLDKRHTYLVGLPFLAICAFWQLYDSTIPLILSATFGMNETWSGFIMALDNVLALFLLPLFGAMSDKCKNRMGRRLPYLMWGTLVAVVLTNMLPLLDNGYAATGEMRYQVGFIVVLGALLITMGVYRSPAIALMPDITPKPLRSRANAIVNLLGAIGNVLYLILAAILYPAAKTEGLAHVDYQPLFIFISAVMLVAMIATVAFVREPKLAKKNQELEKAHPEWDVMEDDGSGDGTLPRRVRKSLIFLLCSICLWFIGYNAVITWFTTYAIESMGMSLGGASVCMLIAMGGAISFFLPVGAIATKIGRKRTIMSGIAVLATCFALCYFMTNRTITHVTLPMCITFLFIGFAWASINVNGLPMVVEMCRGSDVGKFTGIYHTASMTAQAITPLLAGFLMHRYGYHVLFPYSAIFVGLSFFTMLFVRHGDSKGEKTKGIEAFANLDMD